MLGFLKKCTENLLSEVKTVSPWLRITMSRLRIHKIWNKKPQCLFKRIFLVSKDIVYCVIGDKEFKYLCWCLTGPVLICHLRDNVKQTRVVLCPRVPVCRIWQMWLIFSNQHKVTAPKVLYNHYHLHVKCVIQTDPEQNIFEGGRIYFWHFKCWV